MAAGTKMESTGVLQYAGSAISAGKTRGLLSVFTDVSSATPNSGGLMYPRDNTGIPSYGYLINSGSYAGDYYINRNDTVGETAWKNINNSSGKFRMDDYYNYVHWPTDNKFVTIWDNMMAMDNMNFIVKCNGQSVLNATVNSMTVFDPSSGNPYTMASGSGSAGAFSVSAINTNWTVQMILTNTTQMMPTNINYDVKDYTTNLDIASGNVMLDMSNSWTQTITWTQRYYSIMKISLQTL